MPGWRGYPGSRNPAYQTPEYKRARRQALERAQYRCEIRTPGICTTRATEADHRHGLAADPGHRDLQAACTPCHRHKTATEGASKGQRADPEPRPTTAW